MSHQQAKQHPNKIVRRNPMEGYIAFMRSMVTSLEINQPGQSLVLGKLRARDWSGLLDLADSFASQQYGEISEHFRWNQLASVIRKVPFVDPRINPEATAVRKFLAAEHRCKRVNMRFRAYRGRFVLNGKVPPYLVYLERAREYIKRVLGEHVPFDDVFSHCDFGPGASVGVHGNATHFMRKLSEPITVTPSARPYLESAFWAHAQIREYILTDGRPVVCYDRDLFRSKLDRKLEHVCYNKVTFVPKTAKTHRSIAIEPTGNGFLQKGVDELLKTRLQAFGVNLRDQTRNKRLAYMGSQPWRVNPLVTIDLSAASDSLASELVRYLLPSDWWVFLNAIRSPCYTLPGAEGATRYEKFTSMGNGFCFPLESLVFAALVHSVYAETKDSLWAVYGDDIIVHQSSALLLIELLRFCGFRTNVDKTFIFGPFRESCGADYFEGVNVRPYTLDFIPQHCRDWIKIANSLWDNPFFFMLKAWEECIAQVQPRNRYLRPIHGQADSAITVPLDTFMSSPGKKWNRAYQCWVWREFLSIPIQDPDYETQCTSLSMYGVLRGTPSNEGLPSITLRRKTRTVRRWCLPDAVAPHKGAAV